MEEKRLTNLITKKKKEIWKFQNVSLYWYTEYWEVLFDTSVESLESEDSGDGIS